MAVNNYYGGNSTTAAAAPQQKETPVKVKQIEKIFDDFKGNQTKIKDKGTGEKEREKTTKKWWQSSPMSGVILL